MMNAHRTLRASWPALALLALGACDSPPVADPKVEGPDQPSPTEEVQPGPCEGALPVPDGELLLMRTSGPPNSATLALPGLRSLCITLESEAASASVALDDLELWTPSFFKNKPQSDTTLLSGLDGGPSTLHATIAGAPGSTVKLKAYYHPDTPADGSGPATPDEALLIGEAFIRYHADVFGGSFAAWKDAHAIAVTEIADAEGSVAAYELSVRRGDEDAGYLVLETDPLRPILGSASLSGPPLTEHLVTAYTDEYGESPLDASSRRFLWAGAAMMALETGDGDTAERVETCPTCNVTYESAHRPDVERSELGFSNAAWIAERKLKIQQMLDHLALGPTDDMGLKQVEAAPWLSPQHGLAQGGSVTGAPSDPSHAMYCPLGYTNSVPGGRNAFNHYYQEKVMSSPCPWAEAGEDKKQCGWSGCVPIAVLTLLDYWDRRYPFLLGYDLKAGETPEMSSPKVRKAINDIRLAIGTTQLGATWDYQALTLPKTVLGLEDYILDRAKTVAPVTDPGWTVTNDLPLAKNRLSVLKREIDAGYPAIVHCKGDKDDLGGEWIDLPDHGMVAFEYVDDGDANGAHDLMGVMFGWKATPDTRQHIVPVSGIGIMTITSVRPTCDGEVSGALCASFDDIPEDHWGRRSAETLACRCVIRGHADGNFGAEDDVTKAEFLKMIVILAFGVNLDGERATSEATQVCESHWASGYIEYAHKLGLLNGPLLTNGRFEPDNAITRQEAAYLVVEAGKKSEVATFQALYSERECFDANATANPYTEDPGDPAISAVYLDHVLAATSRCVFEGYKPSDENPNQSFKPTKTISRIEAAKVTCVARFGADAPECDQNYTCLPLVTCDG